MLHSVKEMERWSGRVALVTGGSSGIGAATVRRLASHGLKVVACGRQVDRIQVTQHTFIILNCNQTVPINKSSFSFVTALLAEFHVSISTFIG